MRIVHAALPDDWVPAQEIGSYAISTRGRTLAEEGFIHASTVAQTPGTLDRFYAGVDEVVLLLLDVAALAVAGSPVRWERVADLPEAFPHVYGPLPLAAVVAAVPVRRAAGGWSLPDFSSDELPPAQ